MALDVFTRPAARFADADVAAVDSKAFSTRWDSAERDATLSLLARWRERTGALLWLDSGDSTALMQPWVLPFVDRYLKAQLLRDRTEYRHAWYGQRPYTDHAHRYAAIVDASPARSQPVTESRELAKLGVYWNSGLADHSLYGPWRAAAFRRLPLPSLLGYTNR
ncbi:MAG: hypothetical protein FJX53_14265, partial [Alphaproteobacteria bacterium]|nr:hypothetical protein [Alphaproteobacteria bacterium]